MKTSPDCLTCFIKQARYTTGLATSSVILQKNILEKSTAIIASFDHDLSPPENAVALYRMIAEMSGNPDIYAALKKNSTRAAMEIAGDLAEIIRSSDDKLETATRLAIAGNIIDYGAHQEFDVHKTITDSLSHPLAINDLESFAKDLEKARNIIYLADNCGELVFDRLLIETLDRPVTLAVKEGAIINDALMKDAQECGLDNFCRIISNGTNCPGTPLDKCSHKFRNEFANADLIISKGQGNFETLSEIEGPIYFLLMVKCPVVAEHINTMLSVQERCVKTGDMVIMRHRPFS